MRLDEKLGKLLDTIFKLYNMKVKAPEEAEQDDVTSDESVIDY